MESGLKAPKADGAQFIPGSKCRHCGDFIELLVDDEESDEGWWRHRSTYMINCCDKYVHDELTDTVAAP